MQIDIPNDLLQRIQQRVASTNSESEIDTIRQALDALDRQDKECLAIQAGIDAMNQGRVKSFQDFDHAFREKHKLSRDV
ncbi:MAG: hypothetical protein COA78_01355 [Blastopirellula sp.]|nr:MAG: hypothetical protein COA78_01355 [Blastopirellula sp.]